MDGVSCVCGARYKPSRFGLRWEDGVRLVRGANGEGGGYRSRGAVLWALRVLKMDRWYAEHSPCSWRLGGRDDGEIEGDDLLPSWGSEHQGSPFDPLVEDIPF